LYSKELDKGTKLYYVETRPITFKFMIDLDISDDHYWDRDEIICLTRTIQLVVQEYLYNEQAVICCVSPEKMKNDKNHTGIHLIWPNLFVMSETALCLRQGIIQKLKNEEKVNREGIDWNTVLDETIYTRNGFRMVGSDKMNRNKIPENREIKLFFVMNADGELNESYHNRLANNTKALIIDTSIRLVFDTYLEYGMDIKIPTWLEEDPIQRKRSMRGQSTQGVVVGTKEHMIIEKFVKSKLPKEFANCVRVITRYPDNNILIKTNTRYCINVGRPHNGCGVYLFASPRGIYQKCLCPCNNLSGRKHGLCMDYTSECFEFDEETRKLLFPNFVGVGTGTGTGTVPANARKQKVIDSKTVCDKIFEEICRTE
jgi:hypothetical protein